MSKSVYALSLMLFSAAAVGAEYEPGFVWDRIADWTPGVTAGTSLGNADDDLRGNPVWFYGNVGGGDSLGGSNPWYTVTPTAQVWDDSWIGARGNQSWVKIYNGAGASKVGEDPPIARGNIIQSLNPISWNFKPLVKWTNPAGNGAIVDIDGTLDTFWNGVALTTYPDVAIEVAFAQLDASLGTYNLLYSAQVSNPKVGTPYAGGVHLPIPDLVLHGVRFDDGDSLVFSVLGIGTPQWPASWVGVTDNFTITLVSQVPEPSEFAVMIPGLLMIGYMWRRRRCATAIQA